MMSKIFKFTMLEAVDKLAELDADVKKAVKNYGYPEDRMMPASFQTLIRIIIGQQISRQVADTLWNRLNEQNLLYPSDFTSIKEERLMQVGLSRRKSEYIIGIAKAIIEGKLDLKLLSQQTGKKIKEQLTSFRGIGAWTADNFRLFAMQDFDAWPGGDLALQEAMKILKKLPKRPSNSQMNEIAEKWFPYRGAGALMLWHLYANTRGNRRPI